MDDRSPRNGSPSLPHASICFSVSLREYWNLTTYKGRDFMLTHALESRNSRVLSVCLASGEALCCFNSQGWIQNAEENMSINVTFKGPLSKEQPELCKEGASHSQ